MRLVPFAAAAIALAAPLPPLLAQSCREQSTCRPAVMPSCRPPSAPVRDAKAWLSAAASAIGTDRLSRQILHYNAAQHAEQSFQSDRTYPPFFSAFASQEIWFDPDSGAERVKAAGVFPGGGPGPANEILYTARSTWMVRDTTMRAFAPLHAQGMAHRALNPFAVILDWQRGADAGVEGICPFRDYPRVVLTRTTDGRTERLFLDPKTAFPVKLERREAHYLWGDVLVEYLWSTWIYVGGVSFPSASFRLVDGAVDVSRTVGTGGLIARADAPVLAAPDSALSMDGKAAFAFLQPTPPDTVRIGPNVFLLVNPGYTEAVALARDTVFMLEATQGDARARADSVWIGKLFPGKHPIVVVVTDLAWPHIAGVRFWVARGATIASHRISKPFLDRVLARRWSDPDALEKHRLPIRFRPVDDSLRLAGGDVVLHAIDGIGSEGALMAWLPAQQFLWASDYVQDVSAPNQYVAEVTAAARRAGIRPARLAAQHLRLTEWSKVEQLR